MLLGLLSFLLDVRSRFRRLNSLLTVWEPPEPTLFTVGFSKTMTIVITIPNVPSKRVTQIIASLVFVEHIVLVCMAN